MVPRTVAPGPRLGVIHLHSDYSHDGRDSLERLREWALERGIGFVGLSDHAEDFDSDIFERYVGHCRSLSDAALTLIPGLEFRFEGLRGLHLLALGLQRWIAPESPAEFIAQSHGACGLTVLAHPVLAGYEIPEAVLAGIDAVEVWNAAYNTRYLPDPRAIRLLHTIRLTRPEVVGTAGLDQHDSRNDRETRVLLHRAEDDPLGALRRGEFTNVGRTMRFDPAVRWSVPKLAGLAALRWGYDRVERLQDRFARRMQR